MRGGNDARLISDANVKNKSGRSVDFAAIIV